MLASYAILRVLMKCDAKMITFDECFQDWKPSFYINFDSSKILTVGKQAIGEFLKVL